MATQQDLLEVENINTMTVNPDRVSGGIDFIPNENYKPPTSSAISLDQLNPVDPIKLPEAQPTANPLEATAAGAQATSKSLDQYIKELTPPETETSKQYDKLTADISSLLPGLGGRGEEQVKAEQDAGLPQLKTKLADLNAQILSKVAEAVKSNASYEQLIADAEAGAGRQGMSTATLLSQQGAIRRQQLAEANNKSADLMLLSAVAQGLQGNISAMQGNIDRAIDLKYADRESELDLKMKQLGLLEGKLNKEEEITKLALERRYAEEREAIAEEKAKAKERISLSFSANVQTPFANRNGEFFRVSDGQGAKDPDEFFKMAGVKSFEEAYRRGLVTDLTPSRVADVEFTQQLRAKYPDAGITISDSPTTARQKLQNSRIYQEEIYRAPEDTSRSTTVIDLGNGRKQLIDTQTGEVISEFGQGEVAEQSQYQIQTNQKILQSVDELLPLVSGQTTGLGGKSTYRIPGTAAYNFNAQLETLKSNIAFGALTAMREASKSGGALGQVSDREGKLLESSLAALDIGQSPEEFKKQLQKVKDSIQRWNNAAGSGGGTTTKMQGPDGQVWEVPNNQIPIFRQNGYTPMSFNKAGNASASIERTMAAIGQYESGGNYKALGPKTRSGDRAYGKYQVMGANIPSWTKAALGRSLTPQQFLNDPKAQDAVAKYKMGQYLAQYGTVENVAIAWFAGPGAVGKNNTGKKDIIGTSVPKYVTNIRAIYNRLGSKVA